MLFRSQRSLQSCSLVSKSWVPSCRRYLFHTIIFTSRDVNKWLKTFPMPEKSPAHYVKDLRFSLGGRCGAPDNFSKHTPWFTNVEKMALKANMMFPSRVVGGRETLERSFDFSRFPRLQTVTSTSVGSRDLSIISLRHFRPSNPPPPHTYPMSISASLAPHAPPPTSPPGPRIWKTWAAISDRSQTNCPGLNVSTREWWI